MEGGIYGVMSWLVKLVEDADCLSTSKVSVWAAYITKVCVKPKILQDGRRSFALLISVPKLRLKKNISQYIKFGYFILHFLILC